MNNCNLIAHPHTFNQPGYYQLWFDCEAVQVDVSASKGAQYFHFWFFIDARKAKWKDRTRILWTTGTVWALVCSFANLWNAWASFLLGSGVVPLMSNESGDCLAMTARVLSSFCSQRKAEGLPPTRSLCSSAAHTFWMISSSHAA